MSAVTSTGVVLSRPVLGAHLRGYVRRGTGMYSWTYIVWDGKRERAVAEGGEFSLAVAMTECRKCVVAARTWWFWGGADVTGTD